MLIDLNRWQDHPTVGADVCIVGGGPAGIVLAQELSRSKLSVCLLESGGEALDADTQDLCSGRDLSLFSGMDVGRLRLLGGSTNHWGGRCLKLDPIDFERRSWVPLSGWPIDAAALAPYYDRATLHCGFSPADWLPEHEIFGAMPIKAPQLMSGLVTARAFRGTRKTDNVGWNFGVQNRAALAQAPNIKVILNANLTHLVPSSDGQRIAAGRVRSLAGRDLRVEAKVFVLACGGIENARLLLNGDGQRAIGNERDRVGRCFMQHPRAPIATLFPDHPYCDIQSAFSSDVFMGRTPYQRVQVGLAATPQAMRAKALLNACIAFDYEYYDTPGAKALTDLPKDVERRRWEDVKADLMTAWKHSPEAMDKLRGELGHAPQPVRQVDLVADLESAPDPDNRVTLGADRDRLGMRRPVVRWALSEQQRTTARELGLACGAELTRLGYGRVKLQDWVLNPSRPVDDVVSPTFHFSGTTRMAADPAIGVVDADCRVHSTANLFVAGSSVFPTIGYANPTLTIVALACRLGDHLKASPALMI